MTILKEIVRTCLTLDYLMLQCEKMVKTLRNDNIFNEQKRSRQKGSNINDPTNNDLACSNLRTSSNKTYRNGQRQLFQKNILRSGVCSMCSIDR